MAKLTLHLLGDTTDKTNGIDVVLSRVNKELKSLEKTPVKIKVDTKELDAAIKKLESLGGNTSGGKSGAAAQMQALGNAAQKTGQQIKQASEQADKFVQSFRNDNALPYQTIETLNKGIGQSVQLLKNLNEETGEVESSVETLTTNYKEQRKYIADANAAYAKYSADLAKKEPETALQKQINALTGVSNTAKSAKDSMAVFDKELSNLDAKTGKVVQTLTDEARALHTAEVRAKSFSDSYGELIDHQEKMFDGQVVEATSKYRDELGNVTTVMSRLKGEAAEVTTVTRTQSEAMKKEADAAELASKRNTLLGDSMDRIIAKMAAWQILGNMIAAVIAQFKQAVTTIREVDDALVTIRKVTGFSDSQIADISKQAYSTASKYGVGAADYLSDVAAFSRAGYKEQAAALAELSAKTQIVGDTTAEVANQFLLSVDAAYKYKGSIDELTKVLDGANEIDNKYATSIAKIAEGMGIVAPVAKQVNVGVDELAAAIGTITAVTQRSGNEAARALRALFLNIVGDTKTEIDEGVTWTTGEVEGLQDVIKTYAKDAYDAAKASGEVLNPMEAIAGLAQSLKDGVLNADQLTKMVSDIGGKLRSSQLLAIIQNWDMYQSMLEDFGNAAGSADKEVSNALDSWNRKTEILKNTFTEFISNVIETDAIKGFIDLLTLLLDTISIVAPAINLLLKPIFTTVELLSKFIKLLREDLVEVKKLSQEAARDLSYKYGVFSAEGATNALQSLYNNPEGLSKEEFLTAESELKSLVTYFTNLANAEEVATEASEDTADAIEDVGEAAESAGAKVESITSKLNSQALPAFKSLADAYNDITENGQISFSTIADLDSKFGDVSNINLFISRLQNVSDSGETVNDVLTDLAFALLENDEYAETLANSTQSLVSAMLEETGVANSDKVALELIAAAKEVVAGKSVLATGKIEDFIDSLSDETSYSETARNVLIRLAAQMVTTSNTNMSFSGQISQLKSLAIAAGIAGAAVESVTSGASGILKPSGKGYLAAPNATAQINNLFKLIEEGTRSTSIDYVAPAPASTGGGSSGGGSRGGGSTRATEDPAVTAVKAELQARKDNVALLKSELSLMQERGDSTAAIVAQMRLIQAAEHDEADYLRSIKEYWDAIGVDQTDINALSQDWWKIEKDAAKLTEEVVEDKATELDIVKATIGLEEQNLSFLEKSGASYDEQIAKIKEIQQYLHQQAELLRAELAMLKESGAEANVIAAKEKEIVALSTEWWSYQSKIDSLLEKQAKEAEEKRKEAIKAAKEQALALLDTEEKIAKDPLQTQLELLEAQRDALKDQNDEAEKLLAVEKARIALENAQRERTVRQYNSRTGQWEWVANASTVAKARDDLANAEQSLSDFYAQREIDALKDRISEIDASYDTLRDAVNNFVEAVENGTAQWKDAADYILQAAAGMSGEIQQAAISAAGIFGGKVVESGNQFQAAVTGTTYSTSENPYVNGTAAYREPGAKRASVNPYHPLNLISRMQDQAGGGLMSDAEMISLLESAMRGTSPNSIMRNAYQTAIDYIRDPSSYTGPNQIYAGVYDNGGILHGMGGIKATGRDELVLPPGLSNGLLAAEQDGSFNALLNHLGIVTGVAQSYGGYGGSISSTRIGTQNNGNTYQFGSIVLTENQARGMTVYDLAQMSSTLSLYSAS